MVAPTSGLEYRPTVYAWLILFFIIFPLIYLSGKVVGCLVRVILRILFGLFEFLTFDWLCEEEVEKVEEEPSAEALEKQRRKEKKRAKMMKIKTLRKMNGGTISMVVEESQETELAEVESQTSVGKTDNASQENSELGSECETTTDEGLKCTPERELSSSGFGSTPIKESKEKKSNGTARRRLQ